MRTPSLDWVHCLCPSSLLSNPKWRLRDRGQWKLMYTDSVLACVLKNYEIIGIIPYNLSISLSFTWCETGFSLFFFSLFFDHIDDNDDDGVGDWLLPIRSLRNNQTIGMDPSHSSGTQADNRELKQPRPRRLHERHKLAFLTLKNITFPRFAGAIFIFVHFAEVLVLSMTWDDLFCSCVDNVGTWAKIFNSFLSPKRSHKFNSRRVSDTLW